MKSRSWKLSGEQGVDHGLGSGLYPQSSGKIFRQCHIKWGRRAGGETRWTWREARIEEIMLAVLLRGDRRRPEFKAVIVTLQCSCILYSNILYIQLCKLLLFN